MPMTMAAAKGQDEEAELEFNGEVMKFRYNPNAISHRERRQLQGLLAKAQADPENAEYDWVIPYLRQTITSWEFYADEKAMAAKKPLPISAEVLDQLPDGFLSALVTKVTAAMLPPVQPETGSGSSF